jgi:hypothetical protein
MNWRPTKPQLRALAECEEAGALWHSAGNLWRWLRTLPNGMTYQVASNPTIYILKERGLLKHSSGNTVVITDKGRATLRSQP